MAAAAEPVADPIAEPVPVPSVFGDLLQDFERELAMPQNDDNDPETHFNLGIAFREMGLLDEAIGELQKVCRMAGQGLSPARTQQAYIWLATCFVEKSVPEASFKWFLRALEAAPDEVAHRRQLRTGQRLRRCRNETRGARSLHGSLWHQHRLPRRGLRIHELRSTV